MAIIKPTTKIIARIKLEMYSAHLGLFLAHRKYSVCGSDNAIDDGCDTALEYM